MRITIETDEQATVSGPTESSSAVAEGTQQGASPPEDLAARAAAIGALAAGPAPRESAAEGPTTFVPEPASTETTEDARSAAGTLSAGGAPDFAVGEVVAVEADEVEGDDAEDDEASEDGGKATHQDEEAAEDSD